MVKKACWAKNLQGKVMEWDGMMIIRREVDGGKSEVDNED